MLHDVQTAIKRLNKKRRYNQKRKTMILKSPKVMSESAELQVLTERVMKALMQLSNVI